MSLEAEKTASRGKTKTEIERRNMAQVTETFPRPVPRTGKEEFFRSLFIPQLNAPGEDAVPECAGGFSKVAVAKTRILQGSSVHITDLSKGEHRFQCCIHPWMRVKVEVK